MAMSPPSPWRAYRGSRPSCCTQPRVRCPGGSSSRPRAWSDESWDAALDGLVTRGWVDAEGGFTETGREARAEIETVTDRAAAAPWGAIGEEGITRLRELAATLVEGDGPSPVRTRAPATSSRRRRATVPAYWCCTPGGGSPRSFERRATASPTRASSRSHPISTAVAPPIGPTRRRHCSPRSTRTPPPRSCCRPRRPSRDLPITPDGPIGVVGFSMGASWALWLSVRAIDVVAAVVAFYGAQDVDFQGSRSAYLGHFAEHDEFVDDDELRVPRGHAAPRGPPRRVPPVSRHGPLVLRVRPASRPRSRCRGPRLAPDDRLPTP